MISDIIDTIHAKRVDKCYSTNAYSHEYSKVIPNPRFICDLLHIRRVKYNFLLFSLDMFYLMAKEPKNAKQYYREWLDTLKDPYFKD